MPGRGLLTVGSLILIALVCLATLRRLERAWRLLRRLRRAPHEGLGNEEFGALDLMCLRALAGAHVVSARDGRWRVSEEDFRRFRQRRLRLLMAGGLGGALLALLIAASLLHL